MPNIDFISGKHAICRTRFKSQPWSIKIKSTSVEELAQEVEDHVNGEIRARFQKLCNGYHVTHECYDDGSSQLFQNILANQQNEDANQPQLPLDGGFLFKYLDGSKGGYTISGCTLGPMKWSQGGRTERVMHTISYRAQWFAQIPTV